MAFLFPRQLGGLWVDFDWPSRQRRSKFCILAIPSFMQLIVIRTMPIDNQIEPPQSFMTLYLTPGRDRPNAPQEVVLARYEQCEDMAGVLTEHAQTLVLKENITELEVLAKCYQGLLDDASDFNENEARWVIQRLAELLGWEPPNFDAF